VNKTTKKQQTTVLTSSEFIKNKQLKEAKVEREKKETGRRPPNTAHE
jgi:hypothetical protein